MRVFWNNIFLKLKKHIIISISKFNQQTNPKNEIYLYPGWMYSLKALLCFSLSLWPSSQNTRQSKTLAVQTISTIQRWKQCFLFCHRSPLFPSHFVWVGVAMRISGRSTHWPQIRVCHFSFGTVPEITLWTRCFARVLLAHLVQIIPQRQQCPSEMIQSVLHALERYVEIKSFRVAIECERLVIGVRPKSPTHLGQSPLRECLGRILCIFCRAPGVW